MTDLPLRGRVLNEARDLTCGDRDATYGDPFLNMIAAACLIEGYLRARGLITDSGETLTAEDIAHMMTLLKMARTANPSLPFHRDNYTDGAAYQSIAAECAERERADNA